MSVSACGTPGNENTIKLFTRLVNFSKKIKKQRKYRQFKNKLQIIKKPLDKSGIRV
jgi:hypothetical protein